MNSLPEKSYTMSGIPSTTIVVRHSAECPYKDDAFYKRCNCFKHLRWSVVGKLHWKATKQRTWAGAQRFQREFELSFHEPTLARTVSVRDAADSFLAQKRGQNISGEVIKKYSRELDRLVEFADCNQRYTVRQISLQDLSAFRATWEQSYPSSLTRGKVQGRLREFFKYCLHSDLIAKNTASGLSTIKADRVPTQPLSPGQYQAMLGKIAALFPDDDKQTRVHALLQCMRYSGLAIGDTVRFPRASLRQVQQNGRTVDVVITARTKNGNDVFVPIPPEVATEMRLCPNGHPDYFFWNTGTGKPQSAVTNWQHDLRTLFRAAGMADGHPHQLRDTFAVEMLGKGVPIELVSKMLGHESVKTTEKHYAPWVKVRQENLTSVVMATWQSPASV